MKILLVGIYDIIYLVKFPFSAQVQTLQGQPTEYKCLTVCYWFLDTGITRIVTTSLLSMGIVNFFWNNYGCC